MRIYFLSAVVCCAVLSASFAATPAQLIDGKVNFAVATIGGHVAFSHDEKDDYQVRFPTQPVVNLIPTTFEVSVATSGLRFANYTDFKKCVEEKTYLEDKIDDAPVSTVKRNQRTIDFIKAENQKK